MPSMGTERTSCKGFLREQGLNNFDDYLKFAKNQLSPGNINSTECKIYNNAFDSNPMPIVS